MNYAAGIWVACSDRLPTDTAWCLVSDDEGCLNCAAWFDGAWRDWTQGACYNVTLDRVTHWAPLQAPEVYR